VVSVGNLSAGGAGKTPFTIALVRLLGQSGLRVDVLSRGYGRTGSEAAEVDPGGSAEQFGDEPLLIARETGAPVYVGAKRFEAGWLAETVADEAGVPGVHLRGVHVLDDGFQHRQLARQVDIVVVSSVDLDDWLLPAGNLREGLGALRRADVFAVESSDDAAVERLQALGLALRSGGSRQIWRFRREMMLPEGLQGKRVAAFCGIARPGQFFEGLERAGLTVVARHGFRDHHRFEKRDLHLLRHLAQESKADALVTTAKDWVRLSSFAAELTAAYAVHVADLRVHLENEAGVVDWLSKRLTNGEDALAKRPAFPS
jgi:tetraacyldisaccharide 4'-kinase